ncbi:MAG: hypothetical protein HND55_03760 [Pseudomonadota bacterium]|nr:MAG: hypothetical protein HND55_03760 [Pseudomonadota bacterium]
MIRPTVIAKLLLACSALAVLSGCVTYYQYPSGDGVYYERGHTSGRVSTSVSLNPALYPYWSLDYFYFSRHYHPYSVAVHYYDPWYYPYPGWYYGHRPIRTTVGIRFGYSYPWHRYAHHYDRPWRWSGYLTYRYRHVGRHDAHTRVRQIDQRLYALERRQSLTARSQRPDRAARRWSSSRLPAASRQPDLRQQSIRGASRASSRSDVRQRAASRRSAPAARSTPRLERQRQSPSSARFNQPRRARQPVSEAPRMPTIRLRDVTRRVESPPFDGRQTTATGGAPIRPRGFPSSAGGRAPARAIKRSRQRAAGWPNTAADPAARASPQLGDHPVAQRIGAIRAAIIHRPIEPAANKPEQARRLRSARSLRRTTFPRIPGGG